MNQGNMVIEPNVLNWVTAIQNATAADSSAGNDAETMLATSLYPFALWYARRGPWTIDCCSCAHDIEQVANEAVCKLMLVYVRDPSLCSIH